MISLPWEMILGFCTLDEILSVRSVSKDLSAVVTSAISSDYCSHFLQEYLKKQNVYYIPHLRHWKTSATQDELQGIFSKEESKDLYLKRLLGVLRVIKYLPMSTVVAFDANLGRHCLPVRWNATTNNSEVVTFASPSQRNAGRASCPPRKGEPLTSPKTPTNNIYNHLELQSENGHPIDLQSYSSTCVPSMPDDLICPACREAEYRTLVLSEFSYRCEPGSVDERPNRVQLSWTPLIEGCIGNIKKKRRVEIEDSSNSFPPMMEDMAIPIRSHPLPLQRDCKFAISIHCTKCKEFGVFGPAAVCWSQSFCCAERGRTIGEKTLGGVLVRQRCSCAQCYRPVSCPQCAHTRMHEGYQDSN